MHKESTHTNKLSFSTIKTSALKLIKNYSPKDIIKLITNAKLYGCGGAGFSTGEKWNLVYKEKSNEKYIICNADESEPGTFKDRFILSNYINLVLEGMTIAAFAVKASKGIIFLRNEYSHIKPYIEQALSERFKKSLIGKNILGIERFNFNIDIFISAGAYICGEETALIGALEGHRGEVKDRPPFPVSSGFMNKPTVINNVETLAWIPCIFIKGNKWFNNFGTKTTYGRKLFSVSGDCKYPGVYEFPFGITISEISKTVDAKNSIAAQIGGASGQCVPKSQFNHKISFEEIHPGSGSIIFFNKQRNLLDIAENFTAFFAEQSCAQCSSCRIGINTLLNGIRLLKQKQCNHSTLQTLLSLSKTIQYTSKCGLGQSSPNTFLSIIKNFNDDIMKYIKNE